MKTLIYTLCMLSFAFTLSSCGEDEAALPSGHVDIGVDDEKINAMITGQWTKYTVSQTLYSSGKEVVYAQPTQNYQYVFTQSPGGYADSFIAQNFPALGQFEVMRYGKRFTFFNRSSQQRMELMLDEITPTKLVFKKFTTGGTDYFTVESHILMK